MSTRPRTRLNVLEMYSIGCDSKNSIPNKTYIWELEMISINYVIPCIHLTPDKLEPYMETLCSESMIILRELIPT